MTYKPYDLTPHLADKHRLMTTLNCCTCQEDKDVTPEILFLATLFPAHRFASMKR